MDVVNTDLLALVRQAIADPGGTLPRYEGETVPSWSARAALAVIDEHPVLEIRPYYPTQDAYNATCRALEKHRKRADDAEADRDRAREVAVALEQENARVREYAERCAKSGSHAYAKAGRELLAILDGGEAL